MKIFLSHARKDAQLARELTEGLRRAGFTVWNAQEEIVPGDNWAKKVGKALDDSELMVILLTPRALESDWLREDIEFAIGSKKFEGRVFSVYVGPASKAGKDVPWILLKLPHRQVGSASGFPGVVKEIEKLSTDADVSHAHA